jgi:hypothetical protein
LQYQAPLIALAGRWNQPPPEGDKFIPVEIDWGSYAPAKAVQIAISSWSVVEFSQVVAIGCDNSRSGADVDFLFPDTGRQLTVPAYCQGLFPVISNSLMFYVIGAVAQAGDVTVFEILNSLPPPVAVLPSQEQTHAGISGVPLFTNGTSAIVPAGTTGTVQGFSAVLSNTGASAATAVVSLQDGAGNVIWVSTVDVQAGQTIPISQSNLKLRFVNGLNLVISGATGTVGGINMNVYYSVP